MIQEWGLEAWGSNGGCDARVLVTDWVCKCGEKVKLVCVECRKKLSPLHMSSSELPHMMLLRVPSERRMKRRRMKLTKACLRVLAANEWISALKLDKIGSCPTYMFCGSSDDMQPIISRLDVHSLGLKRKEKWWITAYYQFTHRIHSQTDNPRSRPQVRGSKKRGKQKNVQESFLTRPSPGLMLVNWTSSKQADWLIRGSEVVLTVWSQMVFKIFDCRRERQTKCLSGQNNKHKTLINLSLWSQVLHLIIQRSSYCVFYRLELAVTFLLFILYAKTCVPDINLTTVRFNALRGAISVLLSGATSTHRTEISPLNTPLLCSFLG